MCVVGPPVIGGHGVSCFESSRGSPEAAHPGYLGEYGSHNSWGCESYVHDVAVGCYALLARG